MSTIIDVDVPAHSMVEIDAMELAVVICEGLLDMKRPPHKSTKEALEEMEPIMRNSFIRAANAVCDYVAKCMTSRTPVV